MYHRNIIDPTKATSSDDFPTRASKEGRERLCIPIHDIINTMLANGVYPDLWKQALIVPIPKTKLPDKCKDFRPISLLYHLRKIAEQAVVISSEGL